MTNLEKLLSAALVVFGASMIALGAYRYFNQEAPWEPRIGDKIVVTEGFLRDCRGKLAYYDHKEDIYGAFLFCDVEGELVVLQGVPVTRRQMKILPPKEAE